MRLPVRPPLAPMLARLARDLPTDDYLYEPKWDGFRCLAFRDGDAVDLRSRNDRPLGRYFPEIAQALLALREQRFVADGELLVVNDARFDFPALMARLHPAASRVDRLRNETPASYVAFDVLALGDRDVRAEPFERRRELLEALFGEGGTPLSVTPITDDPEAARAWLERLQGQGIDGVVAKHRAMPYEAGRRAMVKVKRERTADCVVAGFRVLEDTRLVGSMLLGLYDGAGRLRHVGVVSSMTDGVRAELYEQLRPLVAPLEGHPWAEGFGVDRSPTGRLAGAAGRWTPDMTLDWIPLRPEQVVEVAYDQLDDRRFRFPARFRRWRPDRDPRSCRLDQLEPPVAPEALAGPLAGR